ncbi:transposase [Streptomyces sp. NPDC056479]|uniref:transposase n=1 Tax=Streptomyces sp. NPDC056479 TaxID=3345832 RepID=UPI0036917343
MSLTERLVRLPDPRRGRGVRYPFVSVVLIVASAVAAARSYTAIGQCAAAALADHPGPVGYPSRRRLRAAYRGAATIRRVLERVCPGGLADLTGGDSAGATTLAVDGKSARGSRDGHVPPPHLLTAMTGDEQTISQLRVPDKTNELTGFARLLAPFDLTGIVVTADAPHTQREHVRFLTQDKQAHYLLVVENNPVPIRGAALAALEPGHRSPCGQQPRGDRRRELRVVRELTVDGLGLDFPGAVQAARITRFRANAGTGRLTRKTTDAITDLPSTQASPQQLGDLTRSHWLSKTGCTSCATQPAPRTPAASVPDVASSFLDIAFTAAMASSGEIGPSRLLLHQLRQIQAANGRVDDSSPQRWDELSSCSHGANITSATGSV